MGQITGWIRRSRSPVAAVANNAGLTLIECLVAIIVMAAVGTAIAPAMVVSVATRVQSQKAEQALRVAQAEIDRVRGLVERNDVTTLNTLPATGSTTEAPAVAAPTSKVDTGAALYTDSPTKGKLVDVDRDGKDDFVVQTYITQKDNRTISGVSTLVGFDFGVRVYDVKAFEASGTLSTQKASLGITSGEGDRRTAPLAVMYTDVLLAEKGQTLCQYLPSAVADPTKNRGCQ